MWARCACALRTGVLQGEYGLFAMQHVATSLCSRLTFCKDRYGECVCVHSGGLWHIIKKRERQAWPACTHLQCCISHRFVRACVRVCLWSSSSSETDQSLGSCRVIVCLALRCWLLLHINCIFSFWGSVLDGLQEKHLLLSVAGPTCDDNTCWS